MGLSTMVFALFLLAVFVWLGRRDARRARTETPAQREKRIKNEKETATALSITDDR